MLMTTGDANVSVEAVGGLCNFHVVEGRDGGGRDDVQNRFSMS